MLNRVRGQFPTDPPKRLGVAVSGGSDSMALLVLLKEAFRNEPVALFAATVDHGLRPEAATEAAAVAAQCRLWNVPHTVLTWAGWSGAGNLQDQARRARYDLLTQWAKANEITTLAVGHTADDQAETVLMRLARSAGVSGLSGMASWRVEGSLVLLRPMLSITRARLRDYLTGQGIGWIDDPSNQDRRFDRIKARDALTRLDRVGITAEGLSRVADNLAQAREALARYAQESARDHVQEVDGDLCFDRDGIAVLPEEIRRRLVVAAVMWLAGRDYPPRQGAVDQAVQALLSGQATTLGGCQLIPGGKKTWICRELNALTPQVSNPGTVWDGRWVLTGPKTPGAEIRPLGEAGILQLKDWRAVAKPRAVVMSTPAVWVNESVLAAPLVGFANGWVAKAPSGRPDFHAAILSH